MIKCAYMINCTIRNKGQILALPNSYWCGTISQLTTVTRGFLSLPRNRKENLRNLGMTDFTLFQALLVIVMISKYLFKNLFLTRIMFLSDSHPLERGELSENL